MSKNRFQPDWHAIAEKFDIWLPFIEPAGAAMISALHAKPGQRVLDVASGTGEPALTLAQQNKHLEVIGSDAAPGMVAVANGKVKTLGLSNVHFEIMPGDKLNFDDAAFDHVMCRFGIMFFEDPLKGLKEMRRVLKPGGHFAFAVWHTEETMHMMRWSYEAFKGKLPAPQLPPLEIITRLGKPGYFESLLQQAGFSNIVVEQKSLNYRFESFEHYWKMVKYSEILKAQLDALPKKDHQLIKNEIAAMTEMFMTDSGLHVPHDYLLATGNQ